MNSQACISTPMSRTTPDHHLLHNTNAYKKRVILREENVEDGHVARSTAVTMWRKRIGGHGVIFGLKSGRDLYCNFEPLREKRSARLDPERKNTQNRVYTYRNRTPEELFWAYTRIGEMEFEHDTWRRPIGPTTSTQPPNQSVPDTSAARTCSAPRRHTTQRLAPDRPICLEIRVNRTPRFSVMFARVFSATSLPRVTLPFVPHVCISNFSESEDATCRTSSSCTSRKQFPANPAPPRQRATPAPLIKCCHVSKGQDSPNPVLPCVKAENTPKNSFSPL
ncbi:hypothetical protein Sjap_003523 [Stephania japonica]|uniref:Uncharacterized protein n=1 Tax=Stephania japonica TaxID=461633 RepID=A0AAP0KNZ1_9MAGN